MRFVITEFFQTNARQLCSSCFVFNPLTGKSVHARAIWDTGAAQSCISPAIAAELGLPVVTSIISNTANGKTKANIYAVDIAIGNIRFPKIDVSSPPLAEEDLVLIGMDIIGMGKFTVQNTDVNGVLKKVLTLELP